MMTAKVIIIICSLLSVASVRSAPLDSQPKATCGYESCKPSVPGMLNVHIVPHTHDDVGWLKTVDQYFYGDRNEWQRAGVQYILNTVVRELAANPERRFIYVETSFFWTWWLRQDAKTQQLVKDLINNGQLEIIGGGWSMNDEAAVSHQSTIDQFTYALKKLNETFGPCARPHIGWQIDPFGHSREMASLFSQMGFDGLFFARIDYQDRNQRVATKTSEMMWKGSKALGNEIFTSVLYRHYSPPPGFCFDVNCNDDPIIDNENIPDYNVNEKVDAFINYVKEQSNAYTTNNVLITMGDDFTYQSARMWFKNIDKLIRYVNERQASGSDVNVFYSTPSCYAKAVNDASPVLASKEDDFFPYSDVPHNYLTGYFTSRPSTKYIERMGSNFLQVCRQLSTLAKLSGDDAFDIEYLEDAMGIIQHHDAITGTEREHVFKDYTRIMTKGLQRCGAVVDKAARVLTSGSERSNLTFHSCIMRNVSQCDVTENSEKFVVTIYNALSNSVTQFVRLPVLEGSYSVKSAEGVEQAVQLVPVQEAVLTLPERTSQATQELVFRAKDLPPLGFRSYYITRLPGIKRKQRSYVAKDFTIQNENIQISIDEATGLLKSVTSYGQTIPLSQNFYYYLSEDANNSPYVFRPKQGTNANVVSSSATVTVYKGELVQEIHQKFSNWTSQVVRIYTGEDNVELEWLVGPIPSSDNNGKDVVSRFTSDLGNGDLFYTDSNCREMIERKLNFRATWDLEVNEPISGNYYPVTSKILIKDDDRSLELAVLTDRAQGGASLNSGEIELMVHRLMLQDVKKTTGEGEEEASVRDVDKDWIIRGTHYVMAGSTTGAGGKSLAAMEREQSLRKRNPPWVLVSPADALTFEAWSTGYVTEFSVLQQALPPNVNILTLQTWSENTLLLRLEHIMEGDEDASLSEPVTINLQTLFQPFTITSIAETTLAANQLLHENQKLPFGKEMRKPPKVEAASDEITLSPMQIRTFLIEVAWLTN